LTDRNSNGFMPGEAAGALRVGRPTGRTQLVCSGLGFAIEKANIDSSEPLRANGLTLAFKTALSDAGSAMHDLDFRIADLAGEQYYFKEANLALSRLLRVPKEDTELWHPAECTGAVGAATGTVCLAIAQMAALKGYAPGRGVMLHTGNDEGQRAAIVGFLV
jgi:3-oxoacyl-[acyl-carrier-protein] synthase-1